jgi:CheY-like chemotaxis protein
MDIKMPEMNGYEAIKILRSRGVETPIIAQTAYARIEDEHTSLKMGFNGYISKPIDRKKLFDI